MMNIQIDTHTQLINRKGVIIMATKITIANSKGGVGKTTVTSMISYILAEKGHKVLLVDFDPQANATQMMTKTFYEGREQNLQTIIHGFAEKDLNKSIHQLTENLFLIPSAKEIEQFRRLINNKNRYLLLDKEIKKIEKDYDFIFFDVPPTFTSEFIENALSASDYFIILTETSSFSLEVIDDFYETAHEIHENINPKLDTLGILINMREDNKKLNLILNDTYNFSNTNDFFKNYFPRRERIAGYATYGLFKRDLVMKSIMRYDIHDKRLLKLTHKVADELIQKIEENKASKEKKDD